MASGILLSWVSAEHDPYFSPKVKGACLEPAEGLIEGPSLSLTADPLWGPRFSRYFVFCQPRHAEQAEALARAIASRRSAVGIGPLEVSVRVLDDFNPTDHGMILKALNPAIREILWAYPPDAASADGPPRSPDSDRHHTYYVCLSQGTPSMHAVWLVLVQAEILRRATVLQTVPPQFRRPGEPAAREVALDLGKLPVPLVQTIKRSGIREHDAVRRMGGVAVLSHFMAANTYREDASYGLYRLTHTPTSEKLIGESLERASRDLDDVRDLLSGGEVARIEAFLDRAGEQFAAGWERFVEWSQGERDDVKARLRLSLRDWAEGLQLLFPSLRISVRWEEDADIFPELYCEADVVRRGLNAVVENVEKHEYPIQTDRPLLVSIARNDERLELRIEDRGVGFPRPADRFSKRAGSTGGGLTDVKQLSKWFHVRIDSTSNVSYDLSTGEERLNCQPYTGTTYVLTCQLPPTRESRPSEREP